MPERGQKGKPIKEMRNAFRDRNTGAVINNDVQQYKRRQQRRRQAAVMLNAEKQQRTIESLQQQIDELKALIEGGN